MVLQCSNVHIEIQDLPLIGGLKIEGILKPVEVVLNRTNRSILVFIVFVMYRLSLGPYYTQRIK